MVEVNNVSIRYRVGDYQYNGLKTFIARKIKKTENPVEFWANKDISFTLEQGDMLGIIGTNGAGKSTLLKAVSGIMAPTKGTIKTNGTIAALLELGTGFDGKLTVRENTYLRGAMLGYTRKFMDETYDSIIDFAELREFQDRPFKQLSSGMKARLAFSIASLVNPDILILDEVLAVGDGSFHHKSAAKMKEVISGGATTILVTHSIAQVRKMCNKVLWLHKGEQVEFGSDVQGICDRYQKFLLGDDIEFGTETDALERFRDKHVSAVMAKTGWSREYTIEQIEDAKQRIGITYILYNSFNFHKIPIEEQESRYRLICDKIEKNKEDCITDTMENTGWTREYATAMVADARRRLGLNYIDYSRYKFYNIPLEQQREVYQALLEKRKNRSSVNVSADTSVMKEKTING